MKDGFIKVCAIAPRVKVADCVYNGASVLKEIEQALALGASVIVCPELCVSSATLGDAFAFSTLTESAEIELAKIVEKTSLSSALIFVGLPVKKDGNLYDAVAVIKGGEILGVVPKTYPEKPFSPAPNFNSTITVCEKTVNFGAKLIFSSASLDGFSVGVEIGSDAFVPLPPSTGLALAGATVIVNPSCTRAVVGKSEKTLLALKEQSRRLICAYVTAENLDGESSTDNLYNGQNFIVECGKVLSSAEFLKNKTLTSEIDIDLISSARAKSGAFNGDNAYDIVKFSHEITDTEITRWVKKNPFLTDDEQSQADRCAEILEISALGLVKRVKHTNTKSVVIGLSGGLDSCLALLTVNRAFEILGMDKKLIYAISMPCFGTSKRTKSNSEKMANALGVSFREINIKQAVLRHFSDIGHDGVTTDITYENAQARERTQVLMDIANSLGGMVIGTGDLSELALGWATYNGDQMSMYGVNASIPKTIVRRVVKAQADIASEELKSVLLDIVDTPVSPELLPTKNETLSQITEDFVGPYELHDFFIYHFLKHKFRPRKIYRLALIAFDGAYSPQTIKKWLAVFVRRFFAQQFKRSCMPDGIGVGTLSLSPRTGLSLPSDAVSAIWINEVENL